MIWCTGNSIYHFSTFPDRVHWNNHKHMLYWTKEFEENHKWKVITWLVVSSPGFPSNFGIFHGRLVGILGHEGWWQTEWLVSLERSGRFKFSEMGSLGLVNEYFTKEERPCGPPYIVWVTTLTPLRTSQGPGARFHPGNFPTLVEGPTIETKFQPKGNPTFSEVKSPRGF